MDRPRSGSERVSDDSPGEGWLAIVTISMPDGNEVDSTIPGIYTYLSNRDIGGSKSLDTANNRIDLDFPDRPSTMRSVREASAPVLACPYFLLAIEEEDDDGVLATLSMVLMPTACPRRMTPSRRCSVIPLWSDPVAGVADQFHLECSPYHGIPIYRSLVIPASPHPCRICRINSDSINCQIRATSIWNRLHAIRLTRMPTMWCRSGQAR